jgi:DNA-directed RNA polymerase subunit RPC12/RpoP
MSQQLSCPNCGSSVAFGMRFCGNCGTGLNWPVQQQIQQSIFKRHQSGFSQKSDVSAYTEYVCPHCGGRTAFTWEFGVLQTEEDFFLIPSEPAFKLPIIMLHADKQVNLSVMGIYDKEGDKLVPITSKRHEQIITLFPCAHCPNRTGFICGVAVVLDDQKRLLLMRSSEPQDIYGLPVVILMRDGKGNLSIKGIYHT